MTKLVSEYLPQIGYWDQQTGIMQDGSLFAMFHISGFSSDLASAHQLINIRNIINIAIMSVAAPNVEIWHHFVRANNQIPTSLTPCKTWFGKRLDNAYYKCISDNLFRNDLFLTIILKKEFNPFTNLKKIFSKKTKAPANLPYSDKNFEIDFEELVTRFTSHLSILGIRRLGIRIENNELEFQEITEALFYIVHGYSSKIGLTAGISRMGRQVMTSELEIGDDIYALHNNQRKIYSSILSFFDYPKTVSPILFDMLLKAPFAFTITNSFCCAQRLQSLEHLELLRKKRLSSKDKATGATEDLNREMNELADHEFVRGSHHFSISIHSQNVPELDRQVAKAINIFSNLGITIIKEKEALKAAFFAQFPGNASLRPRPAGINSRNFASFANLHNIPYGRMQSRWGDPVIMLRSSANTEYALHMQAQGAQARPGEDVANMLIFGGIGSGKTTLMALIISALDRLNVQRVIIDKDKGLAPCVEANGGEYLVLPSGENTGVAPLIAAKNTPDWQSHLQNLITDLIKGNDSYQLTPHEDKRLQQAIQLQLQLPPSERSLWGVKVMLGERDSNGASARLERWCRGRRLGWAFDGEIDRLQTNNLLTGFDTTALLKETEIASPLLRHIFFRTNLRADGSPLMFMIDEFWKAGSVDVFQEFTQDQSKTGRKREIAMMLATQSPRDAVMSPIAYTLKEQYPTKIFFGDSDASLIDLCGDDENNPSIPHLGLTISEYNSITKVLPQIKHSFLIKRPGDSIIVRNDMSKALEQVAVLSGRDATYDLMRNLQKKYGHQPEQWVPYFEQLAPTIARNPKQKERAII